MKCDKCGLETESLAVLAKRKGFRSVRIWPYANGGCAVDLWKDSSVLVGHEGKDYAEAESKARAYLMALEDKEGA